MKECISIWWQQLATRPQEFLLEPTLWKGKTRRGHIIFVLEGVNITPVMALKYLRININKCDSFGSRVKRASCKRRQVMGQNKKNSARLKTAQQWKVGGTDNEWCHI